MSISKRLHLSLAEESGFLFRDYETLELFHDDEILEAHISELPEEYLPFTTEQKKRFSKCF